MKEEERNIGNLGQAGKMQTTVVFESNVNCNLKFSEYFSVLELLVLEFI
jgi:hypothetical protein